ncbi:MAG: ankyrin repeat domain-containing protein [Thiotrichaceae bacterium]
MFSTSIFAEAVITELKDAAILIVGTKKPTAVCGVAGSSKSASCPDNAFPVADRFLLAVAKNNKALAQRLLQQGVAINYRSQNRVVINRVNVRADKVNQFLAGGKRYQYASGTAYDIALSQSNADMVKWLLQRGANPAAGYFKHRIENTHFANNYPSSYLLLPFHERAKIVSVGLLLAMAVEENDVKKAERLLSIEPRSIHYQGNSLLPKTLRLGKWQLARLIINRGKDVDQLANFSTMLFTPLYSKPTNYSIFEALLRHAHNRKNFNYQPYLVKALAKKDAHALQMLVSSGADLNPKDQKAPLFIAADKNDVQTIKFLLQLGADPNIQFSGSSLLHNAISSEKQELAKALLDGGANVNAKGISERTPIHIAIHKKDPSLTKLLIKYKANIHEIDSRKDTLLHIAVREDKPEIAKQLLQAGTKINAKNNANETPFQIAIRDSKLAMSRVLIGAGAQVNVKDSRDRTPLDIAMNKKDLAFVKLLIHARANINDEDSSENTPLIRAVQQVKIPLMKMLLNAGADVNHANRFKDTALHIATTKVDLNMMRLLLQKGAKVNERNSSKRTPLHIAVEKKHLAMVNLLMQHKPNLRIADSYGRTPLHIAVREKNLPITNLFLQAGSTPNTVDTFGNTPLFDALYWRKVQIARALIKRGAHVNVANDSSRTPLDIALSKGLRGIANTMLQAGAKTGAELGSAGALRVKLLK